MCRIVLIVAVALLGCGDATGVEDSLVGEHQLVRVQGSALPYAYLEADDGGHYFINGNTLTLRDDGTYRDVVTHGRHSPGFGALLYDAVVAEGTWSESAGVVTLSGERGRMDRLTLSGVEIDGLEYAR